jgi:hypothetical protein
VQSGGTQCNVKHRDHCDVLKKKIIIVFRDKAQTIRDEIVSQSADDCQGTIMPLANKSQCRMLHPEHRLFNPVREFH